MLLQKTSQIVSDMPDDLVDTDDRSCTPCHLGKGKALPFPLEASHRAETPLELVHSDVCGPLPVTSIDGYRYYCIFVDDATRFTEIALLKSKSETPQAFAQFKSRHELQLSLPIKQFRSDGGGEYMSTEFRDFLSLDGIEKETSAPYSQQQNGVAERAIQSVNDIAATLLHAAGLDQSFWSFAVINAVHVKNRRSTSALDGVTPYEAFYARKPSVSHLRVFGCVAYVFVPKAIRKKFDAKAKICINLGPAPEYRAYYLYELSTQKIIISRHVRFLEDTFVSASHPDTNARSFEMNGVTVLQRMIDDLLTETVPSNHDVDGNCSTDEKQNSDVDHDEDILAEQADESDQEEPQLPEPPDLQIDPLAILIGDLFDERETGVDLTGRLSADKRSLLQSRAIAANLPFDDVLAAIKSRRAQERLTSRLATIHEAYATSASESINQVPQTHKQAMNSPDHLHWSKAELCEMESLLKCETYDLVALPPGRQVIGSRWVYALKHDQNGDLIKYKARLVAQGFKQLEGIDYDETFHLYCDMPLCEHYLQSLRNMDYTPTRWMLSPHTLMV
jgi:hypothetical protein